MSHYCLNCRREPCQQWATCAEADAKLAWTRVTELQARGTELLLELRAARRRARAWKALAKQTHEEAKTLAAEAGQLASDLDRAQSLADYYEYEYACMDRSPFDDVDE